MRSVVLLALSLSIMIRILLTGSIGTVQHLALPVLSGAPNASSPPSVEQPPMDVCFAPGTPDSTVEAVERMVRGGRSLDYFLSARWSTTATNGSTGSEGQPITLTYSFIPDGTTIGDNWGSAPSVLFQRMNALFGSPSVWQARFASIFAEWGRVAGVHYVQVSDDGAPFPNSNGSFGHRGDVRIGSKALDGENNVLAYDYFPDQGDMVLDASENWAAPGGNFIFMRNVITHEHGHGLGLEHVCPISQTKLLEPFYSAAFDGPQHDDIRAGQRNYGDANEPNNTSATATPLGTLTQDSSVQNVGLDHVSDVDFYSFAIAAGKGFTVTLQPVGFTYLNGRQNGDGSCSNGTMINSLNDVNLDLALYDGSGNQLLWEAHSTPAGETERIYRYPVSPSGASFMAKVLGSGTDAVQLYRLNFDLFNLYDPYLTITPIDFDSTLTGHPLSVTTWLINTSPGTRQITGIDITSPFTVSPNTPLTLAPHDSAALTVTYPATNLGTHTGTLTIAHDGPGGSFVCNLTGTTIGAWLHFVVSNTVDVGEVPVGSTDSARVPVRAVGNIPLQITSVQVPAPFSLNLTLPFNLNPGQTRFIYPRFSPTALGLAQAALLIFHNGIDSPDTLYLTATGTASAVGDRPAELPKTYSLAQNYPNPFNPTTTIAFDLPRATNVHLQVFDITGRLVKDLVNGEMPAGRHNVSFDGSNLASGVYLYRLTSREFTATSKMALIK